ncbi:MAG: (2Fe-2S)-binding protein, partial [Candidatus Sericytochromatia bacterium]|nr:(2Fe-2S)-binding protein [Candidatus Sericytochromatia bacterium]
MTCCDSSEQPENVACPTCGTKGQPVTAVTIASLLLEVSKHRLQSGIDQLFCPDATCRIVYFARTGSETFTIDDLAVPVWQKRSDDPDVPVCYCFGHPLASLADEIQRTGKSTALTDIAA